MICPECNYETQDNLVCSNCDLDIDTYNKIKEAEEAGLFKNDPEKLRELETRLKGTIWDNFILGMDKARQGLDGFNEVAANIGENLADVLAEGAIDAFDAFIDGSKKAGEAFRDFAKDTLSWLTKIILRQILLNAVMGIFPSLGKANTGGTVSAAMAASVGHKGMVAGEPAPIRFVDPYVFANAKRLHSGLAPDEIPAILQKGETVLPKGQGINLEVDVINETGVPMEGEEGQTRFDGEKYVTDIHLTKLMTSRSYRQANRRF